MPDFFRGKPFPKDEDGNKELLKKFFAGTLVMLPVFSDLLQVGALTDRAKLDDRLPEAIEFANHLKDSKGYSKVSILGYCWGELITCVHNTQLTCRRQTHPPRPVFHAVQTHSVLLRCNRPPRYDRPRGRR
jgi:dienelactone hydrolase